MSYVMQNGASTAEAVIYTPQAEGQPDLRVKSLLQDAEDIVRALAPPPDRLPGRCLPRPGEAGSGLSYLRWSDQSSQFSIIDTSINEHQTVLRGVALISAWPNSPRSRSGPPGSGGPDLPRPERLVGGGAHPRATVPDW